MYWLAVSMHACIVRDADLCHASFIHSELAASTLSCLAQWKSAAVAKLRRGSPSAMYNRASARQPLLPRDGKLPFYSDLFTHFLGIQFVTHF